MRQNQDAGGVTVSRSSSPSSDVIELAGLCHSVVSPSVHEKLRIRVENLRLPIPCGVSANHVRCKVYIGPQSAILGSHEVHSWHWPHRSRVREFRLDLHDGAGVLEVDLGVPPYWEPWALRLKLYHRPVASLFTQEKIAEVIEPLPRPLSRVQLDGKGGPGQYLTAGSANLEVLRIVPARAIEEMQIIGVQVLAKAILAGLTTLEADAFCETLKELGESTLRRPEATKALEVAASLGKVDLVRRLLARGVPASAEAARCAVQAGTGSPTKDGISLARVLLLRTVCHEEEPLIVRALAEQLPCVADRLLKENPEVLSDLPIDGGLSARLAHAAGAWTVLSALLDRGDPMPVPTRLLLDYGLRAGHVGLARACLERCEGIKDMEAALKSCLDNGRLEIVREALEVQWKTLSNSWSEGAGPPLLALECGPGDEPPDCNICFEPLYKSPGVFLCPKDRRSCTHFCCLSCAEHVQDEAAEKLRHWRERQDTRRPPPPGPCCPLCRAAFTSAARLIDPTIDPRRFFRLACVPEEQDSADDLKLTEQTALHAICALLPLNPSRFAEQFHQELWPKWTQQAKTTEEQPALVPVVSQQAVLVEADFLRPGGMLAWMCDHLLELKVEEERGLPPRLDENPIAWFRHFDYVGVGRLTKPELLRGIAKVYDVSCLAIMGTPKHRQRADGIAALRSIVDAVWDEHRWAEGVPLGDFQGSNGLAERLFAALPREAFLGTSSRIGAPRSTWTDPGARSIEEALAQARFHDLRTREADVTRARQRAQKQFCVLSGGPHTRQRARLGSELLIASVTQAPGPNRAIRQQIQIRCPFCGAINAARAASGNQVICGSCHQLFAVPLPAQH